MLLARRDGSESVLSFADPEVEERFVRHRTAVDRGDIRLLEVCRIEHLQLLVDRIHYFSHWITPEGPRHKKLMVHRGVSPLILVPEHEMSTALARSLQPESVPHEDAIFNVSRSALLIAALLIVPTVFAPLASSMWMAVGFVSVAAAALNNAR